MVKVTRQPKKAAGINVIRGLKAGFAVTQRPIVSNETKTDDKLFSYSKMKNKFSRPHKTLWAIRAVIHDVVGFLPFERRCQELLKVGREKKALKFCKRRLGSYQQAKNKREKLTEALRQAKNPKK